MRIQADQWQSTTLLFQGTGRGSITRRSRVIDRRTKLHKSARPVINSVTDGALSNGTTSGAELEKDAHGGNDAVTSVSQSVRDIGHACISDERTYAQSLGRSPLIDEENEAHCTTEDMW